jgi:hypothetical protein
MISQRHGHERSTERDFNQTNNVNHDLQSTTMAAARLAYARRIDLAALLESPQPVIDLHTQEYEVATRQFLKAIQTYTTRGIEEIKSRQSRHAAELKKAAEKKAAVEQETRACKLKEIELMEGELVVACSLVWSLDADRLTRCSAGKGGIGKKRGRRFCK